MKRLREKPIEIPENILSSLQVLVVQHRNRVTGKRVCFEIAEIDNGKARILFKYNTDKNDKEV